jgi:trehalose 6-phosphate synthase
LRSFADYVVFEAAGAVTDNGHLRAFERTARAEVFPIGIDTHNFAGLARSPEAYQLREEMVRSLGGRDLIIGVDRLDYSKGLKERMEAFERLLEQYPDNRNNATLVQIAPPSRTDIPEYMEVRSELQAASGRINGRFGDFNWVPIRYLNRAFSRQELAGLFQASKVAMVTPFRDGMNLVAKEYVTAQREADPGVLVLSRFAGAARQLETALIVNPHDTQSVAEALQRALHMPLEERRERWGAMMEGIRKDDVFAWRNRFVAALSETQTSAAVS